MGGKGRAPCCDKTRVKKGPWSPAEDLMLISFIQKHGHSNWRALPKLAGLLRCGKSCRLRWINYLRPDVKRGNFSLEEEETIIRLHKSMGNKWSKIASHLPGRTDNEIKNVWNTYLKKKLARNEATCDQNESKNSLTSYSTSPSPSSSSCISYGDSNLDKVPGDQETREESAAWETDDQNPDAKFSAVITQGQCKPIDEPKEEPVSRVQSNVTANIQSLTSTVKVSSPQEETTSPFYCSTGLSDVQNVMTTEAIQEKVSDEKIEIPFDCDVDFWSMLDALNPIQSCEFQPQQHDVTKAESTNFGGGTEYEKWLRYLENELGLVGTDSYYPQKAADEELVMKSSNKELMFKPEIDPAMPYFSMWPSLPQDFSI